MRSFAVMFLIVFLAAVFLQPMIETVNIFKDKIALGAAIQNSCRAASNLALTDDSIDLNGEFEGMRNLDAQIDPNNFAIYFAEAFGETFNIAQDGSSIVSGNTVSMKFSAGGRWDKINIQLEFQDTASIDSSGLGYNVGYNEAILDISLSTPYVFRTNLLQQVMRTLSTSNYILTEKKRFVVRVIN
jgi:hypothetical protein